MHFHHTLLLIPITKSLEPTHSRPKGKDPWRLSQLTRMLKRFCAMLGVQEISGQGIV